MDNEYLSHHGILGQKWGVRRYQNKDGSLTSAGKKRYLQSGTHGDFMGQSRDQDIRIKSGTESYRVQQSLNSKYKDGHTYVTFDPKGHLQYLYATCTTSGDNMGLFNGAFKDNEDTSKGYSVNLKLTTDLIMPSYDKSIDSFLRTVNNVGIKEVAKSVDSRSYKAKDFMNDMKKLKVEECRDRAYEHFMSKVTIDQKLKESFFNDLKEQGYNAVIDDNDHHFGKGSYSGAPVIVFEKNKNLKQTKAREITKDRADDIAWIYGYYGHKDPRGYKDLVDKWDSNGKKLSEALKKKEEFEKRWKKEHPNEPFYY